MNSRKPSSYTPYSRMKTILSCVYVGLILGAIVYGIFPQKPIYALYPMIFFVGSAIISVFQIQFEPFSISSDQNNPKTDKLDLTDYSLCLKSNEHILKEFLYKDIKQIVTTDTSLFIIPLRKNLMPYWIISYDFLEKSNLNPDQIYAKLNNKISVPAKSLSSISSEPNGPFLGGKGRSEDYLKTIMTWALIGIIITTLVGHFHHEKQMNQKDTTKENGVKPAYLR